MMSQEDDKKRKKEEISHFLVKETKTRVNNLLVNIDTDYEFHKVSEKMQMSFLNRVKTYKNFESETYPFLF